MKTGTLLPLVLLGITVAVAQAADSKANWTKHCAMCHGPDGKGQTKMGAKLAIKDLTNPEVQAKLKDEEVVKAIKDGVTVDGKKKMPAFSEKLNDDEIRELVPYVRGLVKK